MNEREFLNLVAKESSFLVAAHEMKTPLSIIRQLSLTLNDDGTEISDDERSRILRQIDITSERALRLVQDLTKISKLEDAMFELEPINSKKFVAMLFLKFQMYLNSTIELSDLKMYEKMNLLLQIMNFCVQF